MTLVEFFFDVGFAQAAVRLMMPLLLGTLGELVAQRSGVVNIGIEGMMLTGALAAFSTAFLTGSLWLGVLGGIAVGMLLGFILSLLVVDLRLDQTVAGLGMTIAATGIVFYCFRLGFGSGGTPPAITPFTTVSIPVFSSIPVFGPVFFNQFALSYIGYLALPLISWFLWRTGAGLALRTVGENPKAAASAGVDVIQTRRYALLFSGGMAGLAGAYLNLAAIGGFTFGIVSGRGFICLALVVLGRWSPIPCALAALLFGAVDSLQLRLQTSSSINIPYQLMLAAPYAATLVALILSSRNARAPAALMEAYDAEAR